MKHLNLFNRPYFFEEESPADFTLNIPFITEGVQAVVVGCYPPPDNLYFCGTDVFVCNGNLIGDPGPPTSLPDGLLLCGLDIIILPDDCLVLC